MEQKWVPALVVRRQWHKVRLGTIAFRKRQACLSWRHVFKLTRVGAFVMLSEATTKGDKLDTCPQIVSAPLSTLVVTSAHAPLE